MAEANTNGATRLTVRGFAVSNPNVLRIQGFARALGGSATVTGPVSVEINVPVR